MIKVSLVRLFIVSSLIVLIGCQTTDSDIMLTTTPVVSTPSAPYSTDISTTTTFFSPTPIFALSPAQPTTLTDVNLAYTPWIEAEQQILLYEGVEGIYAFAPNKGSVLVSDGRLIEGQPWSPDGSHFIFEKYSWPSGFQVVVADITTGQITPLTLLSLPNEVYWSADGKYLLYKVSAEEVATNATDRDSRYQFQIALYRFETQENIFLTETMNVLLLAGWSFDSEQIAFVASTNGQTQNNLYSYGQFDLYTLNVNSLAMISLTNTRDIEVFANWSPTQNLLFWGTMAIAETWPNDSYGLEFLPWVANLSFLSNNLGSEVIASLEGIHSPVWSLDGKRIVYSHLGLLCFWDVEMIMKNCLPENSVPLLVAGYEPSWSLDGRWLAMRVNNPATNRQCGVVYILDLITQVATPIDRQGDCLYGPVYWSRIQR